MKDKFNEAKKHFKTVSDFVMQKKVLFIIFSVLLISSIIFGVWIRTLNMPLLKDGVTGETIPLALDPFYFLRIAETISEQGSLPEIDSMRYPLAKVGFSNEILPYVTLGIHKIISSFGDYSIADAHVIYPVIFFALGILLFFFLIYTLTKSKTTALLGSFFLSIIPAYLYRTMAGFADHESIGIFAFFATMLIYGISLNYLEKEKISLKIVSLFALGTAFVSALATVSWGGVTNLLLLIISLSFFLIWIIKFKEKTEDKNKLLAYLLFYGIWILFSIILVSAFGTSITYVVQRYFSRIYGLFPLFILGFLFIDFTLIKTKIKKIKEKWRIIYSLILISIIGFVGFIFTGNSIIELGASLIEKFLHPFGYDRVGLTIAENAQPYLQTWFQQFSKIFFWMFYLGSILFGFEISKKIDKKQKIIFSSLWIVVISGILFSRISANSVLNGTNFISKLIYFGSILIFAIYCAWLYFNKKIDIGNNLVLMATWFFFMIISGRGAVRLFFVITPLVVFIGSYSITKTYGYAKNAEKDSLMKLFFIILFVVVLIGAIISANAFVKGSMNSAKYTAPSANSQWQKAMKWVRENTNENDIFVHWWDYGYWIQYLGDRPTVTDGGHAVGYWDHLVGRYLLTTPNPDSALSYMKTNNVSYLFIDQSDLGKYSAYSSIGSDVEGNDRYSWLPVLAADSSQTQETKTGETKVYAGGTMTDSDIIYETNGSEIFLPQGKTIFGGAIIEYDIDSQKEVKKITGAFFYNNQQFNIPLKYAYFNNKLINFEKGIDYGVVIIPKANIQNSQVAIDETGALIYLTEKTFPSLFAKLYLMDDPLNEYPTIKTAHIEQDSFVSQLKNIDPNMGNFVYYNGFRGPMKIWEVEYPDNIITNEEFLKTSGDWGELDNLTYIR